MYILAAVNQPVRHLVTTPSCAVQPVPGRTCVRSGCCRLSWRQACSYWPLTCGWPSHCVHCHAGAHQLMLFAGAPAHGVHCASAGPGAAGHDAGGRAARRAAADACRCACLALMLQRMQRCELSIARASRMRSQWAHVACTLLVPWAGAHTSTACHADSAGFQGNTVMNQ